MRFCLFFVFLIFLFANPSVQGASKGITFQAYLSKNGVAPTVSGVTVILQVLDPSNGCVLREETHTGIDITDGYVNLILGNPAATASGGMNPSPVLSVAQALSNSSPLSGLNCVDADNNIVSSGQTFTPSFTSTRKIRLRTTISGDSVVADFNMRAVPYALNADSADDSLKLGGKAASEFLQTSSNITQSHVENLFSNYSTINSIIGGTYSGVAATASALASTPTPCTAGQFVSAIAANGTLTCATPSGISLTAPSTSGTAPNWTNSGSAYTLNIPLASSTSVTAGLLSKSDYDSFSSKLTSVLTSANIFVGNSSNVATGVVLSGDATLSNAGVMTIADGAITTRKAFTNPGVNRLVATDSSTGASLKAFECSVIGQILSWTGTGWGCAADGWSQDSNGNLSAGLNSLQNNTLPTTFNVAIGQGAQRYLRPTQDGYPNIAIGANALTGSATVSDNSGTDNVAIGLNSQVGITSGVSNISLGRNSLASNTTGGSNIAVGVLALVSNNGGSRNIGLGSSALAYSAGGNDNVALGSAAMIGNMSGSGNIGIGTGVMSNSSGSNNIALGMSSLTYVAGNDNIAMGFSSGSSLSSGTGNIFLGYAAGYTSTTANAVTTGSNNVFIGYNSGPGTSTQLSNSVAIGNAARVTASNAIILGTSSHKVGIGGVTAPTTALQVTGVISPSATNTYDLGTSALTFNNLYVKNAVVTSVNASTVNTGSVVTSGNILPNATSTSDIGSSSLKYANIYVDTVNSTSDRRHKENIQDLSLGLDFINQLKPVSYVWKNNKDKGTHYGLIAQDTEQVVMNLLNLSVNDNVPVISHDKESDEYGIRYIELIAPMIKALQELHTSFSSQRAEIEELKKQSAEIADLKKTKCGNESANTTSYRAASEQVMMSSGWKVKVVFHE